MNTPAPRCFKTAHTRNESLQSEKPCVHFIAEVTHSQRKATKQTKPSGVQSAGRKVCRPMSRQAGDEGVAP